MNRIHNIDLTPAGFLTGRRAGAPLARQPHRKPGYSSIRSALGAAMAALCLWAPSSIADSSLPFNPGERLTFEISWMGIIGGEGRLSVKDEANLGGRKVFPLEISARSTGWVRSLYPVEDRTVSYFDVADKFSRKVEISIQENRYRKKKVIEFYQELGKAFYQVDNDPVEEFLIDPESQDSFSALYALRAKGPEMKVGEPVKVPIFEDRTKYILHVNVLRRERITLKQGMVDTVVIEPKLMTEGIFNRRGTMMVWLTDDKFLTPVMMRSKVLIGSFDAVLSSYSGAEINFIPKNP